MTFISNDGAHLARPSTKKAQGLCYKILETVYTFRWKHSHCFFFVKSHYYGVLFYLKTNRTEPNCQKQ